MFQSQSIIDYLVIGLEAEAKVLQSGPVKTSYKWFLQQPITAALLKDEMIEYVFPVNDETKRVNDEELFSVAINCQKIWEAYYYRQSENLSIHSLKDPAKKDLLSLFVNL